MNHAYIIQLQLLDILILYLVHGVNDMKTNS